MKSVRPSAHSVDENRGGVIALDREKQLVNRGQEALTLRGRHVVREPIRVLEEGLVGHSATVSCHRGGRGVGLHIEGVGKSKPPIVERPGRRLGIADRALVDKTTLVTGVTKE